MARDPQSDTISVREDERFDVGRLERYLDNRLPLSGGSLEVKQFWGGKANLTYLLCYPGAEYVLRRPPLGPLAPSAHDMSREYRVLSVLHRLYPLAPRAFLYCEDDGVIGAPFFVMERRRGVVVREVMPEAFRGTPDSGILLSRALAKSLVRLHRVDYKALRLENLGKPRGFIKRQVEGWTRRWQEARVESSDDMDRAASWLAAHIPSSQRCSLVHNDYKLDNLMFERSDPSSPVAVFDWDMCTLGDPLSDLGALLAYWSEPTDPPYLQQLRMMPKEGFMTRTQLIDEYVKGTGCSTEALRFYHALGLFRVAVIVAQIYVRYVRGQTRDPRFAGFGELVPALGRRSREVAGV